jgi:hypothetical protein
VVIGVAVRLGRGCKSALVGINVVSIPLVRGIHSCYVLLVWVLAWTWCDSVPGAIPLVRCATCGAVLSQKIK